MTDPTWRRPSKCDSGTCVEVKIEDTRVLVRDSKLGNESPVLEYTRGQWALVLAVFRIGRRTVGVRRRLLPWLGWVWRWNGKTLRFTRAEWNAFIGGVLGGEFDLPEVTA